MLKTVNSTLSHAVSEISINRGHRNDAAFENTDT